MEDKILNLYTVWNGNYYTEVLVLAYEKDQARELARVSYAKEGIEHDNLRVDTIIENIQGPVASYVIEG